MYRIRRFGVIKTATVVAVMYMLIVAVFVVPFLLLALVFAPTQGSSATGGIAGILVLGLLAIFGYGLLGWVFTAIAAGVYNFAARWVGGIEVEIETVAPPPPLPAWGTSGGVAPPPSGQPPSASSNPPSAPHDPGAPPPTV